MSDRLNKTSICSVIFLDIVGYSEKPDAEQIEIKSSFNALTGEAIKDIAQSDRIILDTGDGIAIALMGAPEEALFVCLTVRDGILGHNKLNPHKLEVRIGINLGPVRVVSDINGRPNIIGDGINVAQRVMSFAEPNQILVSRSYYEVTSRLTKEITSMFLYSGIRQDKHVREHEVYLIRPTAEQAVGSAETAQIAANTGTAVAGRASPRKRWMLIGAVPLAIVAIAFLSFTRSHAPNSSMPTAATPTPTVAFVAGRHASAPEMQAVSMVGATANARPTAVQTLALAEPSSADVAKKKSVRHKKPQAEDMSKRSMQASNDAQKPDEMAHDNADAHIENVAEKSVWEKFKDNVKQGSSAKTCSQAEIAMNMCR